MNFTSQQHDIFQGLLIFEFLAIIISLLGCCLAVYIVVKVPQFHRNLIGLIGNLGGAYVVIAIARLSEILISSFDPIKGNMLNNFW